MNRLLFFAGLLLGHALVVAAGDNPGSVGSQWWLSGPDHNTNLVASWVLDRSLPKMAAALHRFCYPTNTGATRAWKTNQLTPPPSFAFWLSDCMPPQPKPGLIERVSGKLGLGSRRPPVGYWQGKIVATELSRGRTRVDFFQARAGAQDAAVSTAYFRALEKRLDEVR